MDSTEGAIVAQHVTKRYGPVLALDDLSLEIRRGEVFCLLGPNGSGKTTLMRILAGFLSPSGGTLLIAGVDPARDPVSAKQHIGYVPEAVPLYQHMRVGEFLTFMARLRGVAEPLVAERVAGAAERLVLADRLRAPISTLSRGYRQRVALAQALLHQPPVLILDEPTNGLDPRQIIEVRTLIHSLAGQHTILMSSHILSEVEKTAHRVAVLLGGRLKGIRNTADTPRLEEWFMSLL